MSIVKKVGTFLLFIFITQQAFAYVNNEVQAFLSKANASGAKPLQELSPKDAREVFINLQKSVAVDVSGIEIKEKNITVDGKPLTLTVVRPLGINKVLPVFMFFHGGGWCLEILRHINV